MSTQTTSLPTSSKVAFGLIAFMMLAFLGHKAYVEYQFDQVRQSTAATHAVADAAVVSEVH
jgi:hypothetical protein